MPSVYVACKVCDRDDTDFLYNKNSWDIVRCRNCGFTYTNPIPSREDVEGFYSSGVKMTKGREEFSVNTTTKNAPKLKKIKSPLGRIWIRQLRLIRWNNYLPQNGRFLDVGCAQGHLVLAAKRTGKWDCIGVDIQMHKLKHARLMDLQVKVVIGAVGKLGFKPGAFDIITMTHVLEHTFDPLECLLELKTVMRNKGVGVITVPNVSHPYARLLGKRWQSVRPPGHLWYFSPQTLERLVNRAGMQVIHNDAQLLRPNVTVIVGSKSRGLDTFVTGVNERKNQATVE
jgi:SAM-dependent methyltransferase